MVAIINFKTAATGNINVANHCQTVRQTTKTTIKLHSWQWLVIYATVSKLNMLWKWNLLKATMIRSMHIGKSNLSNNRHILKIYYNVPCAAVVITARQMAIVPVPVQHAVRTSPAAKHWSKFHKLSENKLVSWKHKTEIADSYIGCADIALNVDNLQSLEGSW